MEAEKKNVLPIDRGWAWVITFGKCSETCTSSIPR